MQENLCVCLRVCYVCVCVCYVCVCVCYLCVCVCYVCMRVMFVIFLCVCVLGFDVILTYRIVHCNCHTLLLYCISKSVHAVSRCEIRKLKAV